jgi:pyruvate-ferredoxin/flavodoxin oxidoreductase
MAMTYGNVYVARIALGANDAQTLQAIREAESFEGSSLIIAYCPCVAHGYDLAHGLDQQKAAVLSGYWPLLRYDPRRRVEGKNPLQLDSKPPTLPLEKYIYNEARYTMLTQMHPDEAKILLDEAREDVRRRWQIYQHWAALPADTAPESISHETNGKSRGGVAAGAGQDLSLASANG